MHAEIFWTVLTQLTTSHQIWIQSPLPNTFFNSSYTFNQRWRNIYLQSTGFWCSSFCYFSSSSYVTANGLVPAAYLGPAMHRPNGPPIKTASITANTASCHLSRDRNISSVPTSNLSTVCHTTIPLLKKCDFTLGFYDTRRLFVKKKNCQILTCSATLHLWGIQWCQI